MGSGQITKNLINLDLIEIILFYDLWRHPHPWVSVWVVGLFSGSMDGSGQITKNLINFDLIEIIQFCFLRFVETPPPMGGCVGGWVVQWVNGWGQVILLNIK